MAIAFIDAQAHAAAVPWYNLRRSEPGGSARAMPVTQAIAINHITLEALLDSIIANAARGGDIIIVGHGREGGLSMRLVARSETRARWELISQIARDTATRDDLFTIPGASAAEVARYCMITEAQVITLRAKMNRVRALSLNHVAFRACKMGAWPNVLVAYKPFFRSRLVSAPKLRDTYGTLAPGAPVANMNQWITQRTRNHHMFTYGAAPNRVAVATSGGRDDEHSYTLDFAYEGQATLATWCTRYLGGAGGPYHYHGQWRTRPGSDEAQILFVGDAQYNSNIVTL